MNTGVEPKRPEPSTCSDSSTDPRRLALEEWEAVQLLAESLMRSGNIPTRSPMARARTPRGDILL